MTSSSSSVDFWTPTDNDDIVDCLCLGTGRFLRSVLVPAMMGVGSKVALIQTRGRSFPQYMQQQEQETTCTYPVDTVSFDGQVETLHVPCHGAFTLGTDAGKAATTKFLETQLKRVSVIGVGVTEAGLSSRSSKGMQGLYGLLQTLQQQMDGGKVTCPNPRGRLCIINTDNVPNNGRVIRQHMLELSQESQNMRNFISNRLVFLDTMVDRITSQRQGSQGMVPRCEPIPAKALVVLDPHGDLPALWSDEKMVKEYGVVIRTTPQELQQDILLKLRVANGTHTAVAHGMALCRMLQTTALSGSSGKLLLQYLDALFEHEIYPGACTRFDPDQVRYAYEDWRRRLCHSTFGLSTFFITQNGAAKGGIRLGPTVEDLTLHDSRNVSVAMAFSFACILRWLTPIRQESENGVYRGWLEHSDNVEEGETMEYADGLRHNLHEGWYEFRCACTVSPTLSRLARPLSEWLGELYKDKRPQQPQAYVNVVREYLIKSDGGNMENIAKNSRTQQQFETFFMAVATLYARMVAGDGVTTLLEEMSNSKGTFAKGFDTDCKELVENSSIDKGQPLAYRISPIPPESNLMKATVSSGQGIGETISSVVVSEVSSALAIDLHTHLLPPSHGPLCLWGIDELLTYHYLVAEYFMTAPPSMTPEIFFAMTKQKQADIIWSALFVDRSPISEACRGVITTLVALGLDSEVKSRDLEAIRNYYNSNFRNDGLEGTERFSELVYSLSGVRYAIMTNIPFDSNEAQYWRPKRKEYPARYRSALRVDPLLAGDRKTVETALRASGYDVTLEGARQYLRDWCDTMKPEYMMASTPHNFVLQERNVSSIGVNEDAMKQPFAFVDIANKAESCNTQEDETASVIDENNDLLSEVLMKVCEERDLPVALKIGAHRGVNPQLMAAGDGVVAFADGRVLARLCTRFPKVRFLATFLSRNNQHEACVLASKFRNLHIYGCWWFCNNPSLIREITQMRVEMLGTAFTAQHSDARVLDQLIYKWSHSRAVIANVLAAEYVKLHESGWTCTRGEIRRDVQRLFGGSYEEFMSKSLA